MGWAEAWAGVQGMWGTVVVRPHMGDSGAGGPTRGVWRAVVDSDTVRLMVGEDRPAVLGAAPTLYVLVFRCFLDNVSGRTPADYREGGGPDMEEEDSPYNMAAKDMLLSCEERKGPVQRVRPWVADPGAPLGAPRPEEGFTFSPSGELKVWLADGTEFEGDGFDGKEGGSVRLVRNMGVDMVPYPELKKRQGLVLTNDVEASLTLAQEIMDVDVAGRRRLVQDISEIAQFDAESGTSYRKPYDRLTTMQKAKVWWFPLAMVIFALVSNAFEFYQIYTANFLFQTVANDVVDVAGVWESSVVVDVAASASCAAGYAPLDAFSSWDPFKVQANRQLYVRWEGTSEACLCGQCSSPQLDPRSTAGSCTWSWQGGSESHSTSVGSCSVNATKAGCTSLSSVGARSLTRLPAGTIQGTDALGLPTASSTMSGTALTLCIKRAGPAFQSLTAVGSGGSCGGGTLKCGGICFPASANGGLCPVTNFAYNTTNGSLTVTRASSADGENVLPIINVVLAPGTPCIGRQGHDGFDNPPSTWPFNNQGPSSSAGACKREFNYRGTDSRYKSVAELSQWSLFSANGIGSAMDAGYRWKGSAYSWPSPDDLTMYNSPTSTTTKWKVLRRNAIYWKHDCELTHEDFQGTVPRVVEARDAQTLLVWIHGIFGLFIVGCIFPCIVSIQLMEADQDLPCCPGSGLEEVRNINLFKMAIALVSNIVKIVYMNVALAAIAATKSLFYRLAGAGCTGDDVTKDTLDLIGPMMDEIEAKNTSAITTMAISIFFTIVMVANDARTGFRVPQDIMLGGDADGDGIPDFLQVKFEQSGSAADQQTGMTGTFMPV